MKVLIVYSWLIFTDSIFDSLSITFLMTSIKAVPFYKLLVFRSIKSSNIFRLFGILVNMVYLNCSVYKELDQLLKNEFRNFSNLVNYSLWLEKSLLKFEAFASVNSFGFSR